MTKTSDKNSNKKKVILLDSHAIIHRAYHALPDFATSKGVPTGGLYGVCNMVLKIVEDFKPDHVIACYDLPKPTFRHEAYEDYKGGRKKTDDSLVDQIKSSRDIFKAFGIPIYDMEGYEADDLLGTFSETLSKKKDIQTIIASGDMDTLQLVKGEDVVVFTPKKGLNQTALYNEEEVRERFGFGPRKIIDYKGLSGDPSDNIIGIAGIGDKTATSLITQFGTIEEIYKKLKKDEQQFLDAGIKPRIINLLKEGEEEAIFSKTLATIKLDVPIKFSLPKKTFSENIDLSKTGEVFMKYEFRAMQDRLKKVLGLGDTKEEIKNKKDLQDLDENEVKELKVAVHLLNPNISEPTLDDVLSFSGTKKYEEAKKEILQKIKDLKLETVFEEIEKPLIKVVEKMDSKGFKIDQAYLKKLSKKFGDKIKKLEAEIFKVSGEEFNIKSTKQLSKVLFENLELPTKGIKKTPGGAISTKESELEKLLGTHPIIENILEYRELTKLTSTYIDNILPMVKEDGRLYARFLQTGTSTGRMSSRDPNLQNIPTASANGKLIRNFFVAEKGYKLVAFDYSQIELRAAAILSRDKKMTETFVKGGDIHSKVSLEVFGDETPESRRKAKVINFGILYGMGANALRKNLEKNSGGEVELKDARKYLDDYFEKFSGVAEYMAGVKKFVLETGYSETLFGRKRFFPEINSKVPFIRAMAERTAINAPVQGTAADFVKIAMVKVGEYIEKEKLGDDVKMLVQVHDELIFEIEESLVKKASKDIDEIMESVLEDFKKIKTDIPLVCTPIVGDNWGQLK